MPDSNNCLSHLSAVANFTIRHDSVHLGGKYGILCLFSSNSQPTENIFICDVIELTTALECQKQLLMSSISNLGGRKSLEIAVIILMSSFK